MQKCDHPGNKKPNFEEFDQVMREEIMAITKSDDTSGFDIFSKVHLVANLMDTLSSQEAPDKEVSGPRLAILMRLMVEEKRNSYPPMTPTRLSMTRHVSKNTISSLIRGLEEQGLVTREIDEKDKRVFRLRITEKGREIAKAAIPQKAKSLNLLSEGLTPDEQLQLITLLDKLREVMLKKLHHCRKFLPPDFEEIK